MWLYSTAMRLVLRSQRKSAGARGRAEFFVCDVTSDDSVERVAQQLTTKVGPTSILVNNAGAMLPGGLDAMSMTDWERILSVNLTGYLRCARVFGEPMLAHGAGAMVHVASIAASFPHIAARTA
jgi:NAD(P)-dependent dehydrogenase (short-subunit alcohol dehydrogenase family)